MLAIPLAFASLAFAEELPRRERVISVYDGDTFTTESGAKVRVRLVNTPELRPLEPGALEAQQETERLVLGHTVDMSYGTVTKDSWGRVLGLVEVDGKDLALELLRTGMGHVFLIPPDDAGLDLAPYLEAQKEAQDRHQGIWREAWMPLHMTSFHANGRGDEVKDPNLEYFRVCNVSPVAQDLSGYTVVRRDGARWQLPAIVLPTGYTVQVHSGRGTNQTYAGSQIKVFLGSPTPLWDDRLESVTIIDSEGRTVTGRVHEVKTSRDEEATWGDG